MRIGEAQRYSYQLFLDQNRRLGRSWTPFVMVSKTLEEAGEVSEVVLGLEGIKSREGYTREMLGRELSDLLYNVFIIAESYGLNLEEFYKPTIDKYEEKLFKKMPE